jgi:hypothetical protein
VYGLQELRNCMWHGFVEDTGREGDAETRL